MLSEKKKKKQLLRKETTMSNYSWEPTVALRADASLAETAIGEYYEMQVEYSNEGWHGLLLRWTDADVEALARTMFEDLDGSHVTYLDMLVDEQVFASYEDAVEWCQERDSDMAAKESDE
jgi:hypothetical protein